MHTAWYSVENGKLWIYVVNNNGISRIEAPERPYFFVTEEALEDLLGRGKNICPNLRVIPEEKLRTIDTLERVFRVEVDYPFQVSQLRDIFSSHRFYEADIPYIRRWAIDYDIHVSPDYNKLYWDIEVWDKDSIKPDSSLDPIISIAAVDSQGKEFFFVGDYSTKERAIYSERTILKQFIDLIEQYNYSLGISWFGDIFDHPHFLNRLKVHKIPFQKARFRMLDLVIPLEYAEKETYASYSLEYVSQKVLGRGKKHKSTTGHVWDMSPSDLKEYNLEDCRLLREIDRAKGGLSDLVIELARESYVFPDEVLYKRPFDSPTASAPVDSLILKEARLHNYVLPCKPKEINKEEGHKYKGAIVKQPDGEMCNNILVCDFESLYPNIIVHWNISPDPEGIVIPNILKKLFEKKRGAKGNPIKYWTYKTLMNTVYGVFGSPYFRLYKKELAAKITEKERELIQTLINIVENNMDLKVVYGDSVLSGTPLLCKTDDKITIKRIDDVKEGDYVIDENGWTRVKKVIRKEVEKRMFRVETWTGVVVVTEDHSLINKDGKEVSAKNVRVNDLLGSPLYCFEKTKDMTMDEAWLLGYFVADGTAKEYKWYLKKRPSSIRGMRQLKKTKINGWKTSRTNVNISGQNKELLIRAKNILEEIGFKSKIYAHKSNRTKGGMVYTLQILSPKKSGALEYFKRCYYNDLKTIPDDILSSSPEVAKSFIEGYLAGDGSNKNKEHIWKATDVEQVIYGLTLLARKANLKFRYLSYIGQRGKRKYLREIRFVKDRMDKRLSDDNAIRKIEDLGVKSCVVYDLETDSHHFEAGGVLLHNTDSIFIELPDVDISKIDLVGKNVVKAITEGLDQIYSTKEKKFSINLVPQKFYEKLMFVKKATGERMAKKKYAGIVKWDEKKGFYEYIDIVGLESVKSDTPPFIKEIQEASVKLKLYGMNEELKNYVDEIKRRLYAREIDSQLIISKGVNKRLEDYKAVQKGQKPPPHVRALQKAIKENKWNEQNYKIQYIMRKNDIVEPIFSPNDIPQDIDYDYYWNNYIVPILERTCGISFNHINNTTLEGWAE